MLPAFDKTYMSLKDIENSLKKCDCIRYAAYRTASKLRALQKVFFLDKVQLKVISCVFERHQLQQTENSVYLDQNEVESLLSDIYFAVKKGNNVLLNVDYSSQLLLCFLLKVFDKRGLNTIQVFSLKVGLTLLCEAKPREKYHYLFEQLADHNNCLSKKKLEIFLKKVISLSEHLGEGLTFGSDLIPGTVESCFQCNIGSLGLSEDVFIHWLMKDPQLLVWVSTLYRMQISELVTHNAKCEICKDFPLRGLRYRCLRCLSYDMCQTCFFTGKLNKKHKLKHPVQEYCCPMTSQQSTKAFLLTLRNRLCKKDCKLQYLPALRVDSQSAESLGQSTRLLDEMEVSSRTVINGSRLSLSRYPYKELQNIILQLIRESEKIIPQIDNFCSGVDNSVVNDSKSHLKNCLMKHNAQVKAQVQRLKLLKNYLGSICKVDGKNFIASTPMIDETFSKSKKKDLRVDSINLSPIMVRPMEKAGKTDCQKEMMWDNYELGAYCTTSWEELQTQNRNSDFSEIMPKKVSEVQGVTLKAEESEFVLSTLLGGKTLREPESTFKKGITWLYDNEDCKLEEEKLKGKNEETLEELQSDLKDILKKLQSLSVVTSKEECDQGDAESDNKSTEIDVAFEVDILLGDLINGIEKLMKS